MKSFYLNLLAAIGFTIACCSCSSMDSLTIRTLEPAKITFPEGYRTVLVVDNAAAQPSKFNYEYTLNGKAGRPPKLQEEALLKSAVDALADNIDKHNFFKDVLVMDRKIRNDQKWEEWMPVPANQLDSIFTASNADIILSVDRLVSETHQDVIRDIIEGEGAVAFFKFKTLQDLLCSVYIKGKDHPLTKFSVRDSLELEGSAPFVKSLVDDTIPTKLMEENSESLMEKTSTYFCPSWGQSSRYIYSNYASSGMKNAKALFDAKKETEAAKIWESMYDSAKKPLQKARLANNIALSYEMTDNLDSSMQWAEKARQNYRSLNKGSKYEKEVKYADFYINELENRVKNNAIIENQLK